MITRRGESRAILSSWVKLRSSELVSLQEVLPPSVYLPRPKAIATPTSTRSAMLDEANATDWYGVIGGE